MIPFNRKHHGQPTANNTCSPAAGMNPEANNGWFSSVAVHAVSDSLTGSWEHLGTIAVDGRAGIASLPVLEPAGPRRPGDFRVGSQQLPGLFGS